jgi:hypothetical protein
VRIFADEAASKSGGVDLSTAAGAAFAGSLSHQRLAEILCCDFAATVPGVKGAVSGLQESAGCLAMPVLYVLPPYVIDGTQAFVAGDLYFGRPRRRRLARAGGESKKRGERNSAGEPVCDEKS